MTVSSSPLARSGSTAPVDRLSGRVVGRLGAGEQLVLWALRQRLHDGETPSPVLLHGFRLAFGLALLETALAAFEDLFRILHGQARRDIGLFPLRCACVSRDEEAVIRLVASAQAGAGPWLATTAGRLVAEAEAVRAHGDAAVALARA